MDQGTVACLGSATGAVNGAARVAGGHGIAEAVLVLSASVDVKEGGKTNEKNKENGFEIVREIKRAHTIIKKDMFV